MITPNIQLVMLPIQDWKVARVIKFRFRDHLCDCGGTIVYTRPLTTTYNKNTLDIVDNSIFQAINNLYPNVQAYSEDLLWENSYSNIQKIYDGGRPKTKLTIRMTPSFEPDMLPKLVGQTVYAYDVCLHIFLDYIGDPKNIPSDLFTTQGFPYNEDQLFRTVTSELSTL